jgi:hypothetical protein
LARSNEAQRLLVVVTTIVGLAIGTSLAALIALQPCLQSEDSSNCDLANWQTLVLEGIVFVAGAGIVFYYFQRKSSEQIEKAINTTASRERKRKQNWLEIAIWHLSMVTSAMKDLQTHFQSLVDEKVTQGELEKMRQWGSTRYGVCIKNHQPALAEAMLHLVDILDDPILYNDIQESNQSFYDSFKTLPMADIGGINKEEMLFEVIKTRGKVELLEQFLARLQKEMTNE